MFEFISEKLGKAMSFFSAKGLLTEADVDVGLRELRMSLLEADVALPAIKHLLGIVRERAVGEAVLKGVNPGQQIVKIVYDALLELLGAEAKLELRGSSPQVILLCGLQGGGKTTTAGKLAKWLMAQRKQRVMLASLDVYRPAAIEQLAILAEKVGAVSFESASDKPLVRATAALAEAKKHSADVLILDTAGRTVVDAEMMDELAEVHALAKPSAVILVADGQVGQSAVEVAQAFHARVPLSGLVLTRMDGDMRGGAALSMRFVTGVPILFLGTGEKLEGFEVFRPEGLAGRILGQGDVVALVQKVQAAVEGEDNAKLEQKLLSGQALDMNDIKKQFMMMKRLGGMAGLLDLMPGMGGMRDKIAGKVDDKMILRQVAVVDSMTPEERRKPMILNGKRRLRIAKGAGVTVQDVNKLVKMHEQMNQMAKMMRGGGLQKLLGKMR